MITGGVPLYCCYCTYQPKSHWLQNETIMDFKQHWRQRANKHKKMITISKATTLDESNHPLLAVETSRPPSGQSHSVRVKANCTKPFCWWQKANVFHGHRLSLLPFSRWVMAGHQLVAKPMARSERTAPKMLHQGGRSLVCWSHRESIEAHNLCWRWLEVHLPGNFSQRLAFWRIPSAFGCVKNKARNHHELYYCKTCFYSSNTTAMSCWRCSFWTAP